MVDQQYIADVQRQAKEYSAKAKACKDRDPEEAAMWKKAAKEASDYAKLLQANKS